jgi:Zn-dependent protease with chaperone function
MDINAARYIGPACRLIDLSPDQTQLALSGLVRTLMTWRFFTNPWKGVATREFDDLIDHINVLLLQEYTREVEQAVPTVKQASGTVEVTAVTPTEEESARIARIMTPLLSECSLASGDVPVKFAEGTLGTAYRTKGIVVGRSFVAALSDEQLAGLLAHELAHIVLNHNKVIAYTGAVLILGSCRNVQLVPGFGLALYFISGSFRRSEFEADAFAQALLRSWGRFPNGMVRLLEKLAEDEGAVWRTVGEVFRPVLTHPSFRDRIHALEHEGAQGF